MTARKHVDQPDLHSLPKPFSDEAFTCLKTGIYDDPEPSVFVNETGDFAFLDPRREIEYGHYNPRVKQLGLESYKASTRTFDLRYQKIEPYLENLESVLEVGAGDAGFLEYIHQRHDHLQYACIEPDMETEEARNNKVWLAQYGDFADITEKRFDIVCLFHVLEHIMAPEPFLKSCAHMLSPRGRLIIEVPSYDDPLLTLYDVPDYQNFFFQKQHPYYYSASSLKRLLTSHGLTVEKMIPHQRYGLENHLKWLRDGSPGGDAKLKKIFGATESSYQASLESNGKCDAVIAVARIS